MLIAHTTSMTHETIKLTPSSSSSKGKSSKARPGLLRRDNRCAGGSQYGDGGGLDQERESQSRLEPLAIQDADRV
jgi:hypothetical protein